MENTLGQINLNEVASEVFINTANLTGQEEAAQADLDSWNMERTDEELALFIQGRLKKMNSDFFDTEFLA